MSDLAEVTKLAKILTAILPILTGVRNDIEHQEALALMDELIENYDTNLVVIEALSNVVARYEEESLQLETFNSRQANIDPALATLKVFIEQNGLNATDFESEIGKSNFVLQVLAGEIKLTREHIILLARRFEVSPSVFF